MIQGYREEMRVKKDSVTESWRMGTVESFTTDATIVQFDGEEKGSTKAYKRLYGLSINVGDRVLCARCNGTYVILGAVK